MKKSIKLSLVAASIAALPYVSHAAGMGRLTVLSALGQPLRAEIAVNAAPDELSSLSARVPDAGAFKEAGVPFSPVLSDIRVSVERRGAGAVVRLSSDRPINEPFVDMMLELNWANGRLIREYTFLLDPAQASPGKPVSAVAEPAVRAAPPSAPPSRPVAATTPAVRVPASRPDSYRVKRGDTLNRIAEQTRPDGVTLDQMLVALFRANPSAFDGNMNRLRAGRILSVPSGDAALAVGSAEARREVVAQSADFADYRQRLAQAAVSREPTMAPADQLSSGRIAPKVTEAPNPVSESKDQVRVSKTDTAQAPAASGATGATGARLQALEEDLMARDKALKEANARLAELEKNILQLQQLIELKSKGMAELQVAAAPDGTTPAAPTVQPAPEPVADAMPLPSAPVDEPQEAVQAPAEPAPAPPAAAPVATTNAAAPAQSGFLDDVLANPLNLAAGGGLLALLLGWGLYRKRKSTQPAIVPAGGLATELSIGGASVFGGSGGQSVDTGSSIIQTDFSQSGMSSIDADEGVDPVAEADVYMAYGRDAQAEEILLDALKADPTRLAVHLKLLEIYAQRKNPKQFEHTARELHVQTQGRGAEWQKAAAMGRKLDAENVLYIETPDAGEATKPAAGAAAAVGASVAAAASAASATAVVRKDDTPTDLLGEGSVSLDFVKAGINPENMDHTEMPTSHAELKETWAMPGDLSQYSSGEAEEKDRPVAAKPAPSEGPAPMAGSEIDFNLDLGDAPVEEAPSGDGKASADESAEDDAAHISSALEFDLDIAEDEPQSEADQLASAARHLAQTVVESDPLAEIEAEEAALGDTEALDFSLDVDEADAERTEPMDLAATVAVSPVEALDNDDDDVAMVDLEKSNFDGTLLDFDFEPASADAEPPADATMLDLSSINLDLEAPEAADSAAPDDTTEGESSELPTIEEPAAPASGVVGDLEPEAGAEPDLSLDDEPAVEVDDEGVATKLELARAYEEMGDKDGARELLEEVLKEGNEAHKREARSILERL